MDAPLQIKSNKYPIDGISSPSLNTIARIIYKIITTMRDTHSMQEEPLLLWYIMYCLSKIYHVDHSSKCTYMEGSNDRNDNCYVLHDLCTQYIVM